MADKSITQIKRLIHNYERLEDKEAKEHWQARLETRRAANRRGQAGRIKTDEEKLSNKLSIQKATEKNKKKALALLGFKCSHCEQIYPACCMDFHHKNKETKSFTLSASSIWAYKWEKIEEEVKKCEILCVMCHRIKHTKQQWMKEIYYEG